MPSNTSLDGSADYSLEAGFVYPEQSVLVERADQKRLHACCEIEPEVFGDVADPGLVGRRPTVMVAETIAACMPGWGQVLTVHRLTQMRPIKLDETLTLSGRVDGLTPHPRGQVLKTSWRYIAAEGDVVFEVQPEGLIIDPNYTPGSGERPEKLVVVERAYENALVKTCTPEATMAYCEGTHNPIHFDPVHAREFGFRAPILAGTHTMSFLMEPLYRRYSPRTFTLALGFKRPAFWDDVLTVQATSAEGYFDYLRAVNADNKCVADCRIANLRE